MRSFPSSLTMLPAVHGQSRPEFLRDERLHEIVAATAVAMPGSVAVRADGVRLTYAELIEQAQAVAAALRTRGVGRGDRVVLWVERGVLMYPVMVGILQTGAAYVPVDPDWPADRVRFIAQDCGARCVVASAVFAERRSIDCEVVEMESLRVDSSPTREPVTDVAARGTPDDCAYIIYTSGSTGRPKGVMVSHRAICHFVHAEGSILDLQPGDVVFQGSSLSFDMSLEEIWPAWAAGATLVVGTKEVLRRGSDLAAWLAEQGVTAWTCVPTLLGLQDARIPSLRLLNLGGEICPPELVQAWARPGLRILNTYGPTEAAITATYAELAPGRAVTIGRPLPNYTAYLLPIASDADASDRGSTDAAVGELCLGGPGVALGYVGRPELTAERFIANPAANGAATPDPVLYRTGDRVRLTAHGELEFLGRIDTQVKIRGFRVELAEIEALLMATGSVKQTAVTVVPHAGGADRLVAYVVPKDHVACAPAAFRPALQARLPGYMVPEHFEILPALPMLTSGKVDRSRLPRPSVLPPSPRATTPPGTPAEHAVQAAFVAAFGRSDFSIDDDFFQELGGHSLRAAAAVSHLRRDPRWRHVSMGDLYRHPTARALAAHLEQSRPAGSSHHSAGPVAAKASNARFYTCAAGQALGLVLIYGLFSLQWLIPYLAYAWLYNQEGFTRPVAIAISLTLYLVAIPLMLLIGIVAKWVILGRLRPGEYPLWGWTYYRWWLTQRLLDTVPTDYLGRSPLLALYYRLLGARIGHGVLLDNVPIDAPDCVSIGDNSGFGAGATLSCCTVEDGRLKVGSIHIGRDCYVGASSVVAGGAAMDDGAVLDDLSLLPAGQRIPAGEKWAGSPGRPVASGLRRQASAASRLRRGAFGVVHAVLLLVFPLFAVLPLFPGMVLMTELDQNTDAYEFMLLSPVLAGCFVVSMCLQIAALKWLLVGRIRATRVPVFSGRYVRHWLVHQLMQLSLDVVNSLYATLYLNPWYRLLGVKLGRRAEVSTASSISHDLLQVGDESFVADAVSLGAPQIDQGELVLKPTTIGCRAFIGNSAVIPSGSRIGDGVLIGVLSVPPANPEQALQRESSWFGTPAVFLPQRQKAQGFDESVTFRPSRRLVAQRLAIEFCRVILPSTVMIALTSLLMSWLVDLDDAGWPLTTVALLFPLVYVGYGLAVGAIVAGLKWLVIGRYRPVEKPLWSNFVWRSELVTSAYENLAVPLFADALRGTPFLALYLRVLGCRIGRRVYLDTTDVTEFDVVRIGDDAALNRDCGPQTHLFEDRVMKIGSVDIGARCVVGAGSIVLYDTRMEENSRLGDLSMLMKGETLPAGTAWQGSPAAPKREGSAQGAHRG